MSLYGAVGLELSVKALDSESFWSWQVMALELPTDLGPLLMIICDPGSAACHFLHSCPHLPGMLASQHIWPSHLECQKAPWACRCSR